MRLGLSALMLAALAMAACSSDSGGSGGGGGSGGSGSTSDASTSDASTSDASTSDASTSDSSASTSDSSASSGTGGSAGVCDVSVVVDEAECDADCNQYFENPDAGVVMCTIQCTDSAECGEDPQVVCLTDGTAGGCVLSCDGFECPGEYVCDQDLLVCIPDQVSDG